jgi:eukaryotic-like serine/threonine-protein kinase
MNEVAATKVIGVYTLERCIGEGGTGSVWLAHRNDGRFESKVAIKLLKVASTDHIIEQRFQREGRLLARLAHPHIARILDAGVTGTGLHYLVLEHIAGDDIDRFCDARNLTIEARIRLFLDLLAAVGHAHTHLIVHRDIKPSNVRVTPDGAVKLLDFGIAKLIAPREPATGTTSLTADALADLSPRYAAPEQLLGAPISVVTDVYALGVLLYELLCGHHPTGEMSNASPLQQVRAVLEAEPPRASDVVTSESATNRASTPHQLQRELRGDLDNILAKALKKDPRERYASVRELADDLRRYLRNEPVRAHADSTWYKLRKFVARNRWQVAASTVAVTAILATAAVAVYQARVVRAERDRALALSSRNEAAAEFLNVLITEAAGTEKPMTVNEMLARSESLARAEYRNDPEHRAAVLGMLGGYYFNSGKDERGEALLREAMNTVQTSRDSDLRRKLTCEHAFSLVRMGRTPEALRTLNRVIDEPQIRPEQAAACLQYLAGILEEDPRDGVGALKFAQLGLQRLHEASHPSPVLEALLLATIGRAEHINGRLDVAHDFYTKALDQFARAGRDRGPDALAVRGTAAGLSYDAGEPKRALELYDQIARIRMQDNPAGTIPSFMLVNRGHALEEMGRYGEARDMYVRCAALNAGSSSPLVRAFCLLGLASVSHQMGDLAAADRAIATATSTIEAGFPVESAVSNKLRNTRAQIALTEHRLTTARADLDAVVASPKSASRILMIATLRLRAELNLLEARTDAAEADARQALLLAQSVRGGLAHSCRVGEAWLTLGRVLAQRGDGTGARQAFQSALENLSTTVDASHPALAAAKRLASQT